MYSYSCAGIPTSDVRRGADDAVIIALTFISNQDKTVYSVVQATDPLHKCNSK